MVRNARELKKSLVRRLFTHGLRNESRKETEIGPLPQSWDLVPLGKVCFSSALALDSVARSIRRKAAS